jgi:hypothetical protein
MQGLRNGRVSRPRGVRATQRPAAIAELHLAGTVTQAFRQGQDLPDVALAGPQRRRRTLQVLLLHAVLAPEVQAKDSAREDDEPGHRGVGIFGVPSC